MAQVEKEAFYQGLENYQVYINDTDINSKYFAVKNIPLALTAGKNYFLIKGTSLLKPWSPVRVEVLDVDGNVIYSEIPNVLVDGSYRMVIITVYPTAKNGPATITILGEAQDVPSNWVGKYNVKWRTMVQIDTMQGDVGHAIFKETPRIQITEIYDDSSTYDYVYEPTTVTTGYVRGTSYDNKSRDATYYLLASDGLEFTSNMIGGIVTIAAPNTGEASPNQFVTQIIDVVNSSTVIVSPSYLYAAAYTSSANRDSTSTSFQPREFSYSNYSLVYDLKTQNVGSSNKRISYLDVYATHLDTYAGVVKFVEFYKLPGNVFIGKYPIQPHEMIISGSVFETLQDFTDSWKFIDADNSASLNNSTLINSVHINFGDISEINPCIIVNTSSLYLNQGVEYQLSARVLNKYLEEMDALEPPRIRFNITSSIFGPCTSSDGNLAYFSIDYFDGQEKITNTTAIAEDIKRNTPTYVSKNFIADVNCTGSLKLNIWGDWYISDISIKPFQNGNFNAGEFKLRIPNPAYRLEEMSLGVQFIGGDGNVVGNYYNTTPLPAFYSNEYVPDNPLKSRPNQSYYYIVTGSNTVISHNDNIIDGDLYVARNLRTGIHISGQDNAMIRSVGYEGWGETSRGETPAGFIIFSGSVLPTSVGDTKRPTYEGVGLEMHAGERSGSFRFRTDSTGSFIDIETTEFYFGDVLSAYISGSGGKLIISSSGFYLDGNGNLYLTGSIDVTVGFIGGWVITSGSLYSIDSNGKYTGMSTAGDTPFFAGANSLTESGSAPFHITFDGRMFGTTGSISGWILTSSYMSSADGNIILSSSGEGYFAMGSSPPTAYNEGSGTFLGGDGTVLIGSSSGYRIQFDGENLILSSSEFLLGNQLTQYISGSGGYLQISSSNFLLSSSGDVFISGTINAETGKIGGWTVGPTFLSSSNLVLDSVGSIYTDDFQSGMKGWRIRSDGKAEFENAIIRGTLATTVFEKDVVAAVGGQVIIANATALSGSHTHDTTTFYVDNSYGFVPGEICVLKATGSTSFTTEYAKITDIYSGSAQHSMSVLRGIASSSASYTSGQVLVSLGSLNGGYIYMNAAPSKSLFAEYGPFIDVVVRTGSTNYDEIEVKARLGNLTAVNSPTMGYLNGYGLYTQNAYLEGNAQIVGTLSVGGGNIIGNTFYAGRINKNRAPASDTISQWNAAGNCTSNQISDLGPFGVSQSIAEVVVNNPANDFGTRISPSNLDFVPPIEIDQWWTVSLWAKAISGTPKMGISAEKNAADYDRPAEHVGLFGENNWSTMQSITADNIWNRYVMSFRFTDTYTPDGSQFGVYIYFDSVGTLHLAGIQIERNSDPNEAYVSAYQPTNNTVYTGSDGYGVWAIAGGFGGSMQNPVTALTGSGIFVRNVSAPAEVYQDGIFIGDWRSAANFDGVILSSSGMYGYDDNTEIFSLDANGLFVRASNFYVGDADLAYISGSGSRIAISSSKFYLDGDGNVTMAGTITADDGAIGGWEIDATDIHAASNTAVLSSAGNGYISLGASPPTQYDAGAGIFLGGDGTVLFGDSAGYRIQYGGGNLILSSSDFFVGSYAGAYISASGTKIEIYSSGFQLTSDGNITATGGSIGGWTIGSDAIYKNTISPPGTIYISTIPAIDSIIPAAGFITKIEYGIDYIYSGIVQPSGSSFPWNDVTIFAGYDSDFMTELHESFFYIQSNGAGRVAGGNFNWDTSGNVTMAGTFTSTATITGGIFQTAASGQRVVINSDNILYFISSTGRSSYIAGVGNNLEISPYGYLKNYKDIYNYGYLQVGGSGDETDEAHGIKFGASADTNLYRSAANELKTDDSLIVAVNLGVTGSAFINGNIVMQDGYAVGIAGGNPLITFDSGNGYLEITDCSVGIGTTTPATALDVVGTIHASTAINCDGDIVAYYSSDRRQKDNICIISDAIDKIKLIRGINFDWNNNSPPDRVGTHDVGVIAQEVMEVLPEAVMKRKNDYYAVRYEKLIPLLIEGIKEQQSQIDSLKNEVYILKEKLNGK